MRGLAAGLVDPCIVRQSWHYRRHNPLPEPNFDRDKFEVPWENAEESSWRMENETDSGYGEMEQWCVDHAGSCLIHNAELEA